MSTGTSRIGRHVAGCANARASDMRVHGDVTYDPELGDMDLAGDLTGPRIQSWLDSIASAGAARKAWAVLRQMLRSAVRLGLLDADVTGRVTPPKPSGYEPEVLDIRQIRQLLQGFHGHELEAWLILQRMPRIAHRRSPRIEMAGSEPQHRQGQGPARPAMGGRARGNGRSKNRVEPSHHGAAAIRGISTP